MLAKRLERLGDDQGPLVSVYQLAAVLGVTKLVCSLEQTALWVPPWEALADPADADRFLWRVAGVVSFPGTGLLANAVALGRGTTSEEVSICRGLLLWLAYRAELDICVHARSFAWSTGWRSACRSGAAILGAS